FKSRDEASGLLDRFFEPLGNCTSFAQILYCSLDVLRRVRNGPSADSPCHAFQLMGRCSPRGFAGRRLDFRQECRRMDEEQLQHLARELLVAERLAIQVIKVDWRDRLRIALACMS